MTIDKEQLISLLEEKTGLEREQVKTQLSELVSRIQEAAEEDKTFEVEGFGTFSMEEENLQFEPVDVLETEINNKYAGMKPIELIGAFKEPEKEEEIPEVDMTEPDEVDSEDKWAFDADANEEEKEQEREAIEPESEPQDEKLEHAPESEKDSQPVEKADEQQAEEVFEAVFGTTGQEPEETETQEDTEPREPVTESDNQGDTIGTVIVAVVVVLVLGIGGWMIYDFGFTGTNSTQMSTPSPQSAETVEPAGDNTQSEEQSGQEQEVMEPERPPAVSTGEEETSPEPATQQQNRYGLMGEPNQDIANGYTIVVHSLRDRQQAEQNRQQLQQAGFRSLISQAQVEGTTYYRVGIGQFETVGDAQQAIGDIPQRYRDNNFIKRIQ